MPEVKKQTRKGTKKKSARRKTGGILDKCVPIMFDRYVNLNIYGKSGSGKTTFWSTFPGPILAIISSGVKNSGELRSIPKKDRDKIHQFPLDSTEEFQELIKHQRETREFETVVLDHASSFQDVILKEVLGIDEIPEQLGWGTASQQQWGQVALQMKEHLSSLLSLESCHSIIIAQERVFESDNDADLIMPYIASAVSPSVVNWLNSSVDYICETFKKKKTITKETKVGKKKTTVTSYVEGEVDYCLRTAPDEVFTTKFRKPRGSVIPKYIVDPDYKKFMEVVEGD